jgi:hypothetical protein
LREIHFASNLIFGDIEQSHIISDVKLFAEKTNLFSFNIVNKASDELLLLFRLLKVGKRALICLKTKSKVYMTKLYLFDQLAILQFLLPHLHKQVIPLPAYKVFVRLFVGYLQNFEGVFATDQVVGLDEGFHEVPGKGRG